MANAGNLSRRATILGLALTVCAAARLGAQARNEADLNKQIEIYRASSLRADPPEMRPLQAGRIWTRLGMLYEEAGSYAQSEMAFLHALRLLETPPAQQADMARAMDELGTLYMVRGDLQQAERAQRHALQIRQSQKLNRDLPRSWFHLAVLELREHNAEKALDYAGQAVTLLRATPGVDADDRINAFFVLAVAQCKLRHYPEAIATLQEAMAVVSSSYGPEDFPTGFGSFLLGYAYWKSGDAAAAAEPMRIGAAQVEKSLGWQHPACVSVMTQYEQFLRSTHHREEAREVGEQLKQALRSPAPGRSPETLNAFSLF